MKVFVASVLDCPPEKVWDEVQKSSLLLEVTRPLVRLMPADTTAFPERWSQGTLCLCRCYLFGFLPLGMHKIFFERIDPSRREIGTRESDPLIRRWDHVVRVEPADGGRTRYSDDIDIDAGVLTLPVWLFARWFYGHRQRRWRRVARRLVTSPSCAPGTPAPG